MSAVTLLPLFYFLFVNFIYLMCDIISIKNNYILSYTNDKYKVMPTLKYECVIFYKERFTDDEKIEYRQLLEFRPCRATTFQRIFRFPPGKATTGPLSTRALAMARRCIRRSCAAPPTQST